MELKVYNSLTSKKEVFTPITDKVVGMYVCGPTVYGEPHLGHARSAITFDIIFRYLTYLGYKVRYVRNITDVGHLEDEVNEQGEDKILKKARLEQLEPMEIAQYYTNMYRNALRLLNVKDPSIEPTASGHIIDQIETINKIIENELAYVVNGSVYFDVNAYAKRYHYGQLSGRVLNELMAISRSSLQGTDEKRFHADFALWKKASPEHIMQWSSPWGKGFPGWHIECTAMSNKYLGIPFDIHGGGMDLKFPHHEAEICQSLGAFNKQPVNYWLHNNMVTLNGQKMAKSKGNYITLNELFNGKHSLIEKAFSPMTLRFFMLQAHYVSTIDFSNQSLKMAENALKRIESTYQTLQELKSNKIKLNLDEELEQKIISLCKKCHDAMNDDFNTAKLIATLFEICKYISKAKNKTIEINNVSLELLKKTFKIFYRDILGMLEQEIEIDQSNDLTEFLISLRNQAKKEKNYELADYIRTKLNSLNIIIKDV